jgi:hypothetical protein
MDPLQIPLRDLHLPAVIGWWPLAPGWWAVIAIVAICLGWLLRKYVRAFTRGAPRRHALRQFERLATDYGQHRNAVEFGTELSELLRRTMLAYAARREVAGLTGEAWLKWLDQDMSEPLFQKGAGRNLIELPYRDASCDVSNMDIDGLQAAVQRRLRTPVGRGR